VPVEPAPSRWELPPAGSADEVGVVAVGGDLEAGTLLAAYRSGLFPMPVHDAGLGSRLAWWSPDPRGILPPDALRVSRSLRRSRRRYEVRVDTAFEFVLDACADRTRPGAWITPAMRTAYRRLHHLGWAHSVEAWTADELVGGLYGVAVGALFAGESMFTRATDASKVALLGLADLLEPGALLDVQWTTAHLASLGAVDVPRSMYLRLLDAALARPLPAAFA
jgi:leucyl/phenylalanyl-tRNA--protein transferase